MTFLDNQNIIKKKKLVCDANRPFSIQWDKDANSHLWTPLKLTGNKSTVGDGPHCGIATKFEVE